MIIQSITSDGYGCRSGLVTLVRELYHRRRWGSNLSIMADGRFWNDGVDRFFGQNHLHPYRVIREEEARAHWLTDWYCWWCWSLVGPHESDMQDWPLCEPCSRWYDHAHCYWCWDRSEVWYPGWPVFHLPLCDRCSRRHLVGLGPPWYPNLLQRCELYVRWLFEVQAGETAYVLPREVCDRVACFLAESWRP